MFTIEFTQEQEPVLANLAAAHPEGIKQVRTRNSIGGGHELTLIFSVAALAIPAVRAAVVEFIRSRRFISFSYKGMKFSGHSADDIAKILHAMKSEGVEL